MILFLIKDGSLVVDKGNGMSQVILRLGSQLQMHGCQQKCQRNNTKKKEVKKPRGVLLIY